MQVTVVNLTNNIVSTDAGLLQPFATVVVNWDAQQMYKSSKGMKSLETAGYISLSVQDDTGTDPNLDPTTFGAGTGAGSVSTSMIAAGAVTTAKLAANAVTTAKMALTSVDNTILAAGAATANIGTLTGDLNGSTLPATTIAAGAVTSAKMAAGAAATNVGTLTGDLNGSTLPATTIAASAVTSAKMASGAASGNLGLFSTQTGLVTVTGATTGTIATVASFAAAIKTYFVTAKVAMVGTAGATAGKGAGFQLNAVFTTDGTGAPTQVGSTTSVTAVKDGSFNAGTTAAFAVATGHVVVQGTNGAAGETNDWTAYVEISTVAS